MYRSTITNAARAPRETEWQAIATAPDDTPVLTRIDDEHGVRNEQLLTRHGRLWWFVDGSMYVYYTPTHWRP